MFRHLLIPLDGSRTAELVLPVARYFCEKMNASVTLLHAIEKRSKPTIHGEAHLTDIEDATRYLEAVGQSAFAPGTRINYHVHDPGVGNVAASITSHANEMKADLILLCTHGRGDLGRFLFGTIAQQVLATASQPVLLVPHRFEQAGKPFVCRQILAPVDVSGGHEAGVDLALEVAGMCQAKAYLLAVVPTLETLTTERAASAQVLPSSTKMLLEIERDRARDELATRIESARRLGVQVEAEVARGRPASVIVEAADRLNPDLIVMATHGRKGLDALMSGSVGSAISKASPVCLLIAPITPSPA